MQPWGLPLTPSPCRSPAACPAGSRMPLDAQAFPAAGPVEALPPPGTSRIRQNSMFCRLGFDSHRKGLHGRWEGANKLSEPPLPSLYGMWEAQWFHMACLALPSWWTQSLCGDVVHLITTLWPHIFFPFSIPYSFSTHSLSQTSNKVLALELCLGLCVSRNQMALRGCVHMHVCLSVTVCMYTCVQLGCLVRRKGGTIITKSDRVKLLCFETITWGCIWWVEWVLQVMVASRWEVMFTWPPSYPS